MIARYHRIISAILSIAFLVVIQLFATPQPIFRFLIPAFFGLLAAFGFYNWLYLGWQDKWNWWVWLRPLLFLVGWFGLFFIMPNDFLRGLFLLGGLPLVYFIEALTSNVGQQLLFNEVLLTAFCFFMGAAAAAQYYPKFSLLYTAVVFGFIALLCRASYEFTPLSAPHKSSSALIIALFTTELFWVLNFLPFHYSALALILFNLFYLCWALYYYFIFNHLTPKRIQFHLILASVFILAIVIITPWKILS